MPGLQEIGDDAPARCALCGALAAGPCFHCHRPVCGDCCELTEGGVKTYAVCLSCARRGGTAVGGGWWTVVAWAAAVILALVAVVAVMMFVT